MPKMDKTAEMTDAMADKMLSEALVKAFEDYIPGTHETIVLEAVQHILKLDHTLSGIQRLLRRNMISSINSKVELLFNERVKHAINTQVELLFNERVKHAMYEACTKAALEAELEMAKKFSITRATVIKDLEAHLELRSRQFEDYSGVLEATAINAGEDSLGAGGIHTATLNMANIIHDNDEEVLKKAIKDLEDHLPGSSMISYIEAKISKWTAKEGASKEGPFKEGAYNEEGTTHAAH